MVEDVRSGVINPLQPTYHLLNVATAEFRRPDFLDQRHYPLLINSGMETSLAAEVLLRIFEDIWRPASYYLATNCLLSN